MADDKVVYRVQLPETISVATRTSFSAGSSGSFWASVIPNTDHPYSGEPVDPRETVGYEAAMFFETADIVLNQPDRLPDIVFRNALVEDAYCTFARFAACS